MKCPCGINYERLFDRKGQVDSVLFKRHKDPRCPFVKRSDPEPNPQTALAQALVGKWPTVRVELVPQNPSESPVPIEPPVRE